MSIPVALRNLDAAVGERGSAAYVLTVTERGTPHVVHAEILRDAAGLMAVVGESTARNAGSRPHVTVLYPSRRPEDYSLIVDVVATVVSTPDGVRLRLAPSRAVLHRPAPAPDPAASPCGSDCVPLAIRSTGLGERGSFGEGRV
jgi:hypothetical protein